MPGKFCAGPSELVLSGHRYPSHQAAHHGLFGYWTWACSALPTPLEDCFFSLYYQKREASLVLSSCVLTE